MDFLNVWFVIFTCYLDGWMSPIKKHQYQTFHRDGANLIDRGKEYAPVFGNEWGMSDKAEQDIQACARHDEESRNNTGDYMGDVFPFPYRIFFLYIEPISALAGAYYAAIHPSHYLLDLVKPTQGDITRTIPDTPTLMSLSQLANLYLLFALNEHLVLSSTSSLKTWRRLLFCLLVADLGHLATMIPAGPEIFWNISKWNAMAWGSVGFVYFGAMLRFCFLAGVGLRNDGRHETKPTPDSDREMIKAGKMG
jgi:hypothetical protein